MEKHTALREKFEDQWDQMSPETGPLCYTSTGSDAVNLVGDIANCITR